MTSALKRGRPYAAKRPKWATSPNSAAVRSRRTVHTIWAFCTRTRSTAAWGTNIFRAFWRASARRPRPAGYDVTFINRNVGKRRSSYLEHCRYRGVDGVCVVCVNFLDPQVLELVQSELPS